jgi:hypothetical protein
MSDTIEELEIRLRDAKLARLEANDKEQINRHGKCPHYYGHFDSASFVFGCVAGCWVTAMLFLIIIHFTGMHQ